MKTLEDLRQFYDSALMPDLQILEQKRKAVLGKLNVIFIIMACISAAGIILFLTNSKLGPIPIIIAIVLCAILGGFAWGIITKDLRRQFKYAVIEKLVNFIDTNLEYNPNGYITKEQFNQSKIFHTQPNRYKGDDLVSGKIGQTRIKFSELDAKHESGSGKNRHVVTVFKGLFFIADFNKHFLGRTVVLPDASEKVFGRFSQALQKLNVLRDELVKLEDPEFEKEFVVYGSDQIEARYILSTSLMQRILDFKAKTGQTIYLSFIGSQIYVAVSYPRDLFEPQYFKTLLDFSPIAKYFEDLQAAVGIVEDLNLNTRIWTKQ